MMFLFKTFRRFRGETKNEDEEKQVVAEKSSDNQESISQEKKNAEKECCEISEPNSSVNVKVDTEIKSSSLLDSQNKIVTQVKDCEKIPAKDVPSGSNRGGKPLRYSDTRSKITRQLLQAKDNQDKKECTSKIILKENSVVTETPIKDENPTLQKQPDENVNLQKEPVKTQQEQFPRKVLKAVKRLNGGNVKGIVRVAGQEKTKPSTKMTFASNRTDDDKGKDNSITKNSPRPSIVTEKVGEKAENNAKTFTVSTQQTPLQEPCYTNKHLQNGRSGISSLQHLNTTILNNPTSSMYRAPSQPQRQPIINPSRPSTYNPPPIRPDLYHHNIHQRLNRPNMRPHYQHRQPNFTQVNTPPHFNQQNAHPNYAQPDMRPNLRPRNPTQYHQFNQRAPQHFQRPNVYQRQQSRFTDSGQGTHQRATRPPFNLGQNYFYRNRHPINLRFPPPPPSSSWVVVDGKCYPYPTENQRQASGFPTENKFTANHSPKHNNVNSVSPKQNTTVNDLPKKANHSPNQNPAVNHSPNQNPAVNYSPNQNPAAYHLPKQNTAVNHLPKQNSAVNNSPKKNPAVNHIPKQNPAVNHLPKQNPAVNDLPKQNPDVNHSPKQNPTVNHLPKQNAAVNHLPKQNAAVNHIPKQNPAVNHLPKQNPAVNNSPNRYAAVNHLPKQNPAVNNSPNQYAAVNHLPKQNTVLNHSPNQNAAVNHSPNQNPTVNHLPKQNPAVNHLPKQNPDVNYSPNQNPTVNHLPKQNAAVNHLPKQNAAVNHSPKQNPAVNHSPNQNTAVNHSPNQNTAVYQSPKKTAAVNIIPKQNPAVNHSPKQNTAVNTKIRNSPIPNSKPQNAKNLEDTVKENVISSKKLENRKGLDKEDTKANSEKKHAKKNSPIEVTMETQKVDVAEVSNKFTTTNEMNKEKENEEVNETNALDKLWEQEMKKAAQVLESIKTKPIKCLCEQKIDDAKIDVNEKVSRQRKRQGQGEEVHRTIPEKGLPFLFTVKKDLRNEIVSLVKKRDQMYNEKSHKFIQRPKGSFDIEKIRNFIELNKQDKTTNQFEKVIEPKTLIETKKIEINFPRITQDQKDMLERRKENIQFISKMTKNLSKRIEELKKEIRKQPEIVVEEKIDSNLLSEFDNSVLEEDVPTSLYDFSSKLHAYIDKANGIEAAHQRLMGYINGKKILETPPSTHARMLTCAEVENLMMMKKSFDKKSFDHTEGTLDEKNADVMLLQKQMSLLFGKELKKHSPKKTPERLPFNDANNFMNFPTARVSELVHIEELIRKSIDETQNYDVDSETRDFNVEAEEKPDYHENGQNTNPENLFGEKNSEIGLFTSENTSEMSTIDYTASTDYDQTFDQTASILQHFDTHMYTPGNREKTQPRNSTPKETHCNSILESKKRTLSNQNSKREYELDCSDSNASSYIAQNVLMTSENVSLDESEIENILKIENREKQSISVMLDGLFNHGNSNETNSRPQMNSTKSDDGALIEAFQQMKNGTTQKLNIDCIVSHVANDIGAEINVKGKERRESLSKHSAKKSVEKPKSEKHSVKYKQRETSRFLKFFNYENVDKVESTQENQISDSMKTGIVKELQSVDTKPSEKKLICHSKSNILKCNDNETKSASFQNESENINTAQGNVAVKPKANNKIGDISNLLDPSHKNQNFEDHKHSEEQAIEKTICYTGEKHQKMGDMKAKENLKKNKTATVNVKVATQSVDKSKTLECENKQADNINAKSYLDALKSKAPILTKPTESVTATPNDNVASRKRKQNRAGKNKPIVTTPRKCLDKETVEKNKAAIVNNYIDRNNLKKEKGAVKISEKNDSLSAQYLEKTQTCESKTDTSNSDNKESENSTLTENTVVRSAIETNNGELSKEEKCELKTIDNETRDNESIKESIKSDDDCDGNKNVGVVQDDIFWETSNIDENITNTYENMSEVSHDVNEIEQSVTTIETTSTSVGSTLKKISLKDLMNCKVVGKSKNEELPFEYDFNSNALKKSKDVLIKKSFLGFSLSDCIQFAKEKLTRSPIPIVTPIVVCDTECYRTHHELIKSYIVNIHHKQSVNFKELPKQKKFKSRDIHLLDSFHIDMHDNEVIVTMELRRNLDHRCFPIASWENKKETMRIEKKLKHSCRSLNHKYKGSLTPILYGVDETVLELVNKGIINRQSVSKGASMYKAKGGRVLIVINEEDHFRITTTSRTGDFKKILTDAKDIENCLECWLEENEEAFARDESLGNLCPNPLHTGLSCTVYATVKLEHINLNELKPLSQMLDQLNFGLRREENKKQTKQKIYTFFSKDQYGVSELDLVLRMKSFVKVMLTINGRYANGNDSNADLFLYV